MNKKLHFLLFCLAVIVIIYLSKDKIFEPFGNQIVIHPDNASFDPQETTFSVLTYDSDLGSGVTQVSTCSDDSSWRNGDKTCRDYSLDGTNCEDIGSDGRLAFDACKVACDNCNTYTEVKRRIPSPIEDTDEPTYAQFESSASDGGDIGSDIGGPDYREIIGKLDDLSGKIDLIELRSGYTVGATCVAKNNSDTDIEACAAVTDLSTPNACEAVMTDADESVKACTYTPAFPADQIAQLFEGERERETKCAGNTDAADNVVCDENQQPIPNGEYTSIADLTDDTEKKNRCCAAAQPEAPPEAQPEALPTTTPPTTTPPAEAPAPAPCPDSICPEGSGYTLKKPITILTPGAVPTTEKCCDKTGFCKGNKGGENDIPCIGFYTDKVNSDGNPIQGQTFNNCCEYNYWRRIFVWFVGCAVFSGYILFKGNGKASQFWDYVFIILSLFTSYFIIFTDTIPRWIIRRNGGKWITAHPRQGPWPFLVDFLTAVFFILWLASGVFMYYGTENYTMAIIICVALVIIIPVFLNLTGK